MTSLRGQERSVVSTRQSQRRRDQIPQVGADLDKGGIKIEFVKECLSFTGEDSPISSLLLSVTGAFAEFKRALIGERQREGIALARQRGACRSRE
jgi:DNA invertase Pin-like site-specific DNA recombinase